MLITDNGLEPMPGGSRQWAGINVTMCKVQCLHAGSSEARLQSCAVGPHGCAARYISDVVHSSLN